MWIWLLTSKMNLITFYTMLDPHLFHDFFKSCFMCPALFIFTTVIAVMYHDFCYIRESDSSVLFYILTGCRAENWFEVFTDSCRIFPMDFTHINCPFITNLFTIWGSIWRATSSKIEDTNQFYITYQILYSYKDLL